MTRTVAPCGTRAAYDRHRYYGEKPCEACWEAARADAKRRRPPGSRATPGAKTGRPVTQPCGTHAAFARHRYRGEEPCDACREAERAREAARPRHRGQRPPLQPCGTRAARQRHWRRGETCWVCWVGDVS